MMLRNGGGAAMRGLAHMLGRAPAPKAEAPKAETEEENAEEAAEEETEEGNNPPAPEATEAAAEEDPAEEDEAMQASARAAGASAERARIQAILTSAPAQANRAGAEELAFNTDMAAEAAVALLGKLGGTRGGLASRMAAEATPPLGEGAAEAPAEASADFFRQRAIAAHNLRRGLRGEPTA